jgi:hypothetical protein
MNPFPYFLGFALFFIVVSVGLQYRTAWMWYLGWVILYLLAGFVGNYFFTALYYAQSPAQEGSACIYLLGGLVLWMPVTIWWATRRHLFGVRAKPAQPKT